MKSGQDMSSLGGGGPFRIKDISVPFGLTSERGRQKEKEIIDAIALLPKSAIEYL